MITEERARARIGELRQMAEDARRRAEAEIARVRREGELAVAAYLTAAAEIERLLEPPATPPQEEQ